MRRIIFMLGYLFSNYQVIKKYQIIKKMEKKEFNEVSDYQFLKLKNYLIEAYEHTIYYKELFDEIKFDPYSFSSVEQIEQIPILTKSIIKKRQHDFYSNQKIKYKISKSGGSTGEPLEYRICNEDASWSRALLFNGFRYAGYRLGDSIINIAGGSIVSKNPGMFVRFRNFILNQEAFFTLNMNENDYIRLIKKINTKKPNFIRGYASSIYRLAKFIDDNKIEIKYHPKAIFTTSEVLTENYRNTIERVFNTVIYDQYGLNDGGASAFELKKNNYLLDFERSYNELVDTTDSEEKKIISTSYNNHAMYFIRYDTGDFALTSEKYIKNKPVLTKIIGRELGMVNFKDELVSLPKLTILLSEIKVDRHQMIINDDSVEFKYSGNLSVKDQKYLNDVFTSLFKDATIKFSKVNEDNFTLTKNGKFKIFIFEG